MSDQCPKCHGAGVIAEPQIVMGHATVMKARCPECGGATVSSCPYCEGNGCPECDNTGQRVRTHLDAGDGLTMAVSGSAELSEEAREALKELGRAAYRRMGSGTTTTRPPAATTCNAPSPKPAAPAAAKPQDDGSPNLRGPRDG